MRAHGRSVASKVAAYVALLLAALSLPAGVEAKAPEKPRFKWGQTKETLFLSVMIRDLDSKSVSVSLPSAGDLSFRAKNSKGEEFALDLPLREDVKPDVFKWDVQARADKWGTAVLITFGKKNAHRWDLLVTEPKKFKGAMDKDWAREDQSLEPEEELPYAEDHAEYILALTEKNLKKTMAKFSALVVNVRYPWCSQCKSQDESFAKAAKMAKGKGKKDTTWKKLAFAVLDAREERNLARDLGAKCDFVCEYKVYTQADEAPITMKSKWGEAELIADLVKFLEPAVHVITTPEEVASFKETNTTCTGSFASEKSPHYTLFKKVAGMLRGELVFVASFGKESPIELLPHGQNSSFKFDGDLDDNGTSLQSWIKHRSIPLLQEYDWQLREKYEKLGLPIAKVFLDDGDKNPSLDKIVRHAVRSVAKKFIGRIAFVENKKSASSYELRDFGLNQPEAYPAFGIASNASYNALKYGFEITSEIAPSAHDFWKRADNAINLLTEFCEKVLAGVWPEAHETGPAQTNWTAGIVKQVAWKSYAEIESPEIPLLLQVYGHYRPEHEKKQKEVENLAKALEPHASSLTIASYDTADNFLPTDDFKRDKFSSDTEWYWVPAKAAGADRAAIRKLMKPKKDAPVKTVIEFAKEHSGLPLDVEALEASFAALMLENPPLATTPPPPMDEMGAMGGADATGLPMDIDEDLPGGRPEL